MTSKDTCSSETFVSSSAGPATAKTLRRPAEFQQFYKSLARQRPRVDDPDGLVAL